MSQSCHQASQCIFTFRDSKFISDRHPDSRCDLCHNSDILIRQRFPYRINILPDTDRTGRTDRPALSAAYAVSLCQLSVKGRHNLHFWTPESKIQNAKSLDFITGTHTIPTENTFIGVSYYTIRRGIQWKWFLMIFKSDLWNTQLACQLL